MGTIWSYSVNLPGECIALNDGGYRCECTGTGYHGETCHKGGLEISVIENAVQKHQKKHTVTLATMERLVTKVG